MELLFEKKRPSALLASTASTASPASTAPLPGFYLEVRLRPDRSWVCEHTVLLFCPHSRKRLMFPSEFFFFPGCLRHVFTPPLTSFCCKPPFNESERLLWVHEKQDGGVQYLVCHSSAAPLLSVKQRLKRLDEAPCCSSLFSKLSTTWSHQLCPDWVSVSSPRSLCRRPHNIRLHSRSWPNVNFIL